MGVWAAGLYSGDFALDLRSATELETIGTLPLDAGKVAQVFPGLRPGTSQAINDISIANSMRADPASSFVKSRQDTATIPRIDQLLTS